jgi:hypothetical protein
MTKVEISLFAQFDISLTIRTHNLSLIVTFRAKPIVDWKSIQKAAQFFWPYTSKTGIPVTFGDSEYPMMNYSCFSVPCTGWVFRIFQWNNWWKIELISNRSKIHFLYQVILLRIKIRASRPSKRLIFLGPSLGNGVGGNRLAKLAPWGPTVDLPVALPLSDWCICLRDCCLCLHNVPHSIWDQSASVDWFTSLLLADKLFLW